MNHFNAIVIGGPPYSGKSVLTYSLTIALRRRNIEHYVLRACPDGEGDWSNETNLDTVKLIRQKGRFTADFIEQVSIDIGRRHLPLLVDTGGRPQHDQEVILAQCTHAVLIARDEASLAEWRALAERNGLHVIAELISDLQTEPVLWDAGSPLRARLNGLERGKTLKGAVFDALVERVATYLFEPSPALRRRHLDTSPAELAIDVQVLAQQLQVAGEPAHWLPEQLPLVVSYLPSCVSVGLYGRGPNWLFSTIAAHAQPAAFYQFDVRLGWVQPSVFTVTSVLPAQPIQFGVESKADCTCIEMVAPDYYLDYVECQHLAAPLIASDHGVIVSGRVAHWLTVGLALAYLRNPWVAVYQPQLNDRAVVIYSQLPAPKVGDQIALPARRGAS